MKGYYIEEEEKENPGHATGNLFIEITNIDELQHLLNKAKCEADQLQKTLNQLHTFELKINFNTGKPNSSKT